MNDERRGKTGKSKMIKEGRRKAFLFCDFCAGIQLLQGSTLRFECDGLGPADLSLPPPTPLWVRTESFVGFSDLSLV